MPPTQQAVHDFYAAFARLDAAAMAPAYHEAVRFDDEVFSLNGKQDTMAMWSMLCEAVMAKGRDVWRLEASAIEADATRGRAHWQAHYRFSATGRMVHNRIDASFEFAPDGRILRHVDRFDFWAWSRQALGPTGLLLGWTPLLRTKVRQQAAAGLRRHQAQQAGAQA